MRALWQKSYFHRTGYREPIYFRGSPQASPRGKQGTEQIENICGGGTNEEEGSKRLTLEKKPWRYGRCTLQRAIELGLEAGGGVRRVGLGGWDEGEGGGLVRMASSRIVSKM